jgi:hypothetical protein
MTPRIRKEAKRENGRFLLPKSCGFSRILAQGNLWFPLRERITRERRDGEQSELAAGDD